MCGPERFSPAGGRALEAAGALRVLRVELNAMHDQLTDANDARKTGLSRGGGPPEWDRRLEGFASLDARRSAGPTVASVLPDEDWLSLADAYHEAAALGRTLERDPSGAPEMNVFRGATLVDSLLTIAEHDIELIDRLLPELGDPALRAGSRAGSGV